MTPRLLTAGDNVVDCYPDLGEMFPGGNTVNVAVHAQRNGASAAYLGVLGTDEAGDLLRKALADEGVDTSLTRTAPGPNAFAVVRVVDGNRVFEDADVGISRFTVTEEDLRKVADADLVHTGECSMLEDDLGRLAGAARILSFDFSERPWDYVVEYAHHASIAILSAASTEEDPAALARRVAQFGPGTVVVTQGASGATMLVNGRVLQAPAGTGPVVDTLGAGDAFIARLLVGIMRGEESQLLLSAATSYATKTCAEYGAFGYRADLPQPFPPVSVAG
ncbi:MAG TPA: PfkB family carbohydrate kinase [Nocardioidaceae bacterium]|nr:PfkB family carbohydrate kinase [Nocardioidaceae bacterium]